MAVVDINHLNIVASQPLLDKVRDFYVDILGLHDGWRPDIPVAGYWLYVGDKPLVHLMESAAANVEGSGTGNLDHFAFSCTDLETMERFFQQARQSYVRRDFPAFNTVQLVLTDPAGITVELNFSTPAD